jgi:hypothetical protein
MKWHGLLIHFRADHGSTITLSISFVQINMAKTVLIEIATSQARAAARGATPAHVKHILFNLQYT